MLVQEPFVIVHTNEYVPALSKSETCVVVLPGLTIVPPFKAVHMTLPNNGALPFSVTVFP